jgi:hypothetical protein
MKKAFAVTALAVASIMFSAPVMADRCPTPEEIADYLAAAKKYVPVLSEHKKHRILRKLNYVKSHLPSLTSSEKREIAKALKEAKASGDYPGSKGLAGCKSCGHSMGAAKAAKGL